MASTPKTGILEKISNFNIFARIKSIFGDRNVNAVTGAVTGTVQKVVATAGKVIENGSDIIAAPVNWLKSIQKNWVIYLVLVAIIMVCILFLYCSICYYVNRHTTSSFSSNLIELASVINTKNDILKQKQQLPLPVLNLPKVPQNKK
jgi:hypothetical protein